MACTLSPSSRVQFQIDKITKFTNQIVQDLRARLSALSSSVDSDRNSKAAHEKEAKLIGDEFLQLEKYVNLNYMVSVSLQCKA